MLYEVITVFSLDIFELAFYDYCSDQQSDGNGKLKDDQNTSGITFSAALAGGF